ncbi:alpha-galactosidase [Myxococcota bacterium]|nr:alpha-galactosidase [Myxococcota bacterium]
MEPQWVTRDGGMELRVDPSGEVQVQTSDGRFLLRGLRWFAEGRPALPEEPEDAEVHPGEGEVRVVQPLGGGLRMDCRWTLAEGRVVARPRLVNAGDRPVALDRVGIGTPGGLLIGRDRHAVALYKMGWNVASPSGFLVPGMRERECFLRVPYALLPRSVRHMTFNTGTRFSKRPGEVQSEWFTVLTDPDGTSLLFGFAGTAEHFSQVEVSLPDRSAIAWALMDGAVQDPGSARDLEPVLLAWAAHPDGTLQAHARAMADRHGSRVRPCRLWCSWYSGLYDRVDEAAFLENVRLARRTGLPVEYMQLDDGWQRAIGDWLQTNRKFPSGLESLARSVEQAGFLPGIWTAPFAVSPDSDLFREHPDWIVRNRRGRKVPAGFIMGARGPRFYYGLDTTRPEVREHLASVYRTLRSMGFRLFKVDFLTAAAVPGVRSDPSATRARAYRLGIEAVREGVGEDARMLAGIGPVLGNAGVIDVQRLGPDTAYGTPAWRTWMQEAGRDFLTPGIRNNLAGSIQRCHGDGILWSGDGDALIQQGVPEDQARALAVVASLAGSSLTVGHDLRKGPFDDPVAMRLLASRSGPAFVPDRHGRFLPTQIVADGEEAGMPVRWIALVNLNDIAAAIAPRVEGIPGGGRREATEVPGENRVWLDPDEALLVPGRSVRLFRLERF